MNTGTRRRGVAVSEGVGDASEDNWEGEDMHILRALLETPEPQMQEVDRTEQDSAENSANEADMATEDVVLTALRRQVALLEQEYDCYLEQRVATSISAAGGTSAPRASTIKLYRHNERLTRVIESLKLENERLEELLTERRRSTLPQQTPEDVDNSLTRLLNQTGRHRVDVEDTDTTTSFALSNVMNKSTTTSANEEIL